MTSGPLTGLRVVELGGIGPVPHTAMMLGDMGADVLCVQRNTGARDVSPEQNHILRSRRLVYLDLKDLTARDSVLELIDYADVLLEGFRPGVVERLGLGPDVCQPRNTRLVYGRVTGWGQDGPLATEAGHDINYIALNGALHAVGTPPDPPVPPLNLFADFGGGSMLLLSGVLAALWNRERSGEGQVVDAAMVDGSSLLLQSLWAWRATGAWSDERGDNLIDGAAPFYRCYTCADGRFIATGAIEPKFYAELIDGLGLADDQLPAQLDRRGWPLLTKRFAERFAERTRDEWVEQFTGRDACVTPVLDFAEALAHPHARKRSAFVRVGEVDQPAPAPRFSATTTCLPRVPDVITEIDPVVASWRDGNTDRAS